jgi:hypothetical protein
MSQEVIADIGSGVKSFPPRGRGALTNVKRALSAKKLRLGWRPVGVPKLASVTGIDAAFRPSPRWTPTLVRALTLFSSAPLGPRRLELPIRPVVQEAERKFSMYIGASIGGILLLLIVLWALGVIR